MRPEPQQPSTPVVVLVLALLLGLQPVTTDVYLPALPALTAALSASAADGQLSLSALLLAFGLAQLAWGPVSDRYGRRPVLLAGLGLYVLAALLSCTAWSVGMLLAGRVLQGIALGAGVMGARAIVRDLYDSAQGAHVLSRGLSGVGVFAALAVPVGSVATELLGWRATLAINLAVGGATLAVVALRLGETLPAARRTPRLGAGLAAAWREILGHPMFWAFSLLAGASYAGVFTLLASSPFIFMRVLGLTRLAYGAVMFACTGSFILGTWLCRWLIVRHGLGRCLRVGGALSLAGGCVAAGAGVFPGVRLPLLVAGSAVYMLGHGIHLSCGQSGAVAAFPRAAGSAAALNGCLMMCLVFAMGHWLGTHLDGSLAPLSLGLLGWSVATATVAIGVAPRLVRPAS